MKPKRFTDAVAKAASSKRTMLIVALCILIAIAVACYMSTCSPASDSADGTSTQSSMQSGTAVTTGSSNGTSKGDGVSTSSETKGVEDAILNSSASPDTSSQNFADATQEQSDGGSNQAEAVSSEASQTSGGSIANTDAIASAPEKVWVIGYAQIWVEDSAAWDEQTPVYGYVEKSVCNICGAEITGNEVAHGKAHMPAGEGSGHHTEVSQVVTGYSTTHHAAVGHCETIESGGHWE